MIQQIFNKFLQTKWLGRTLCYEKCVDSTNGIAKKLARQGANHGLLVIADEQNAGKGRIGRSWFSPKGKGLWFSVLLRPKFLPKDASKCTLIAAVAVAKAINNVCGITVEIKWPNDILFDGKKIVGILSEMSAELGKLNFVIIGVGIDTDVDRDDYPDDIRNIAVSLHSVANKEFSREQLLAQVMYEMEKVIVEAEQHGFVNIFNEWRKLSCTLNKRVKVIGIGESYYGQALDIDKNGMLVVQLDNGVKEIVMAGDISIRSTEKTVL